MKRAILLVTVMVMAVLVAFSGVALAQQGRSTTTADSARSATDRAIVKLAEGESSEAVEEANRGIGARTVKNLPDTHLYVVKLPPEVAPEQAVRHYKAARGIEDAEADHLVFPDVTPNDTYYTSGSLWGLHQSSGYDIDAPEAWDITNGSTTLGQTVVAVIDSGVDYRHLDLTQNMWRNPGETAGNGVDDDGNGYTDDVYGYDFRNNDSSVFDRRESNHATHVAGTIAAKGNNNAGVVGVSWWPSTTNNPSPQQTQIMSLKFLTKSGGYTADAIEAVNYMTKMRKDYAIPVLSSNNSWGGGSFNQFLLDAIKDAGTQDIFFVAAAGNGGSDGVQDDNDKTPHYPANYGVDTDPNRNFAPAENVISVTATNRSDGKPSWANYGARSVHLGAPGASIYSTLPGNAYGTLSGTSMATPHVTGTLALIQASNPSWSIAAIKDRIIGSGRVDPVSALNAKTVTGGRLNACQALKDTAASC